MQLHIKHKLLIGALSMTAITFAGLFALTSLQLKAIYLEQEQDGSSVYYLKGEEAVIITEPVQILSEGEISDPESSVAGEEQTVILSVEPVLFEYIEVIDGCGPHFEGECLNARSGPGRDFPIVTRLRDGIVLKVGGKVERNGRAWYKIVFDEQIRYPERVTSDMYVAAEYVRTLLDEGVRNLTYKVSATSSAKRIIVSQSEQMLYAYDGEELFMQESISTGIELTPTPLGTFTIFRKTPSRYMQGPIPGISEKYWDLPGVPWNLYFTHQGAVIHGAYWHDNFGRPSSNGCVNLRPAAAEKLYKWADIGTKVTVID